MQAIRHGDLALIKIEALPEGLVAGDTSTLMQGVNGNNHDFNGGVFYPQAVGDHIIGYFEAHDGCILLHPDHFDKTDKENTTRTVKTAPLPAGIYELRRQGEYKHEGMVPVID